MAVSIFLKVILSIMLLITLYGILTIQLGLRFKYKTIKPNGNSSFIHRISMYIGNRSVKIHFITSDDRDKPHTHPWDFKSFLIIPYKEVWRYKGYATSDGQHICNVTEHLNHKPFTIVKRKAEQEHKTSLYRVFGIKIPALTIGLYEKKKQLCSFCQELGYCKENPPKDRQTQEERNRVANMVENFDPFNGYERIV